MRSSRHVWGSVKNTGSRKVPRSNPGSDYGVGDTSLVAHGLAQDIYIYIYICIYNRYTYVYIYIERERGRETYIHTR